MKRLFFEDMAYKDKINRVHTLAKCRSQTILDEMQEKEEEIRKQVYQIKVRLNRWL
jgi:hypothetical protein